MAQDPRSPDEIERDLAETRRHLDSTLDAIQNRMSPGALFEDALDYMRRDGSAFGRNFVETVRDNPVPATLMTVGLGWMMISGRNGSSRSGRYGALVPAGERESHGPSASDRLRGMGQSVRDQQEAAIHGTSQAAHRMSDSARQGWDSARTGAESAMTRGREIVSDVGQGTRSAGRSMIGFFEENPLAVGAMAVAAGAALAAFLPRTRTEDETLGPLRERAMEQGRAQAGKLADEASERTRAALNAAAHPDSQGTSRESSRGFESKPGGERSGSSSASPMSPGSAATPDIQASTSQTSSSPTSPARPMGTSPSTSGSGRTPPSPSRP